MKMQKSLTRVLSLLLALVMLGSLVGVSAFADNGDADVDLALQIQLELEKERLRKEREAAAAAQAAAEAAAAAAAQAEAAVPAVSVEAPAVKVEAPAVTVEAPEVKVETPEVKVETPVAAEAAEAPAAVEAAPAEQEVPAVTEASEAVAVEEAPVAEGAPAEEVVEEADVPAAEAAEEVEEVEEEEVAEETDAEEAEAVDADESEEEEVAEEKAAEAAEELKAAAVAEVAEEAEDEAEAEEAEEAEAAEEAGEAEDTEEAEEVEEEAAEEPAEAIIVTLDDFDSFVLSADGGTITGTIGNEYGKLVDVTIVIKGDNVDIGSVLGALVSVDADGNAQVEDTLLKEGATIILTPADGYVITGASGAGLSADRITGGKYAITLTPAVLEKILDQTDPGFTISTRTRKKQWFDDLTKEQLCWLMHYIYGCCDVKCQTSQVSEHERFCNEFAEKIKNADKNATLTLDVRSRGYREFCAVVINALDKRDDVSVRVQYRSSGEDFTLYLPAGTDYSRLETHKSYPFELLATLPGVEVK